MVISQKKEAAVEEDARPEASLRFRRSTVSVLPGALRNAEWIGPAAFEPDRPLFLKYSLTLVWRGGSIRFYVTADQRFELFVDGEMVGAGPDCGTRSRWYFAGYEGALPAGTYRLEVRVYWLGQIAPYAHTTLRPGLLLAAEGEAHPLLTTGTAPWSAEVIRGIETVPERKLPGAHMIGPSYRIGSGGHPSEQGMTPALAVAGNSNLTSRLGEALPPVINGRLPTQWQLCATELPEQERLGWTHWVPRMECAHWLEEDEPLAQAWTLSGAMPRARALAVGESVTFAAGGEWSMLLDAEDIVTAYIGVKSRGGRGALVDVSWAESLGHRACLHNNNFLIDKGHRDEVIGKRFYGFGDSFLPGADADGSEYLRVPWWRAGRYLLVRVRTADEPLTLEGLVCERTRYPLPARLRGGFAAPGDAELNAVLALCERGLRNSCHETYSDCPAFEQLMYAGDTRVEILVHRVVDTDDRLARKAVQLFNDSRHGGKGWSWSRYPARLGQVIPGFCLLWVLMVDDFRLWRDDPDFVRDQLVGVRGVLDVFESCLGDDGWLQNLPGWQFIDWSPVWANGVPPADAQGRSTPVQLLYVLALQAGARIESETGSELRAAHLLRLAQRAGEAVRADCWDARKGLFRDAPGREAFSEHSQVLAVLGLMDTAADKRRLLENLRATVAQGRSELAPVSYYFSHYFFEACAEVGSDWLHERLQPWRELLARGLRTPIEGPEPNRSDCHGWSAHPLFHAAASIAGIRPGSSRFASVRIAPLPGPIPQLICRLPWRAKSKGGGDIELDLTFADGGVCGRICLPDGLDGVFQWAGEDTPLVGGVNEIRRESVVLR